MKTKKHLAFFVTIAMVVSLLFTGSMADAPVGSLFLPESPDDSGPGWDWHADSKTLTLDGLVLVAESDSGIELPDDSTIILTDDSVNSITAQNGHGIWSNGHLTIQGAGTLSIESFYSGITSFNSLEITDLVLLDIDAGGDGIIVGGVRSFIDSPVEGEQYLSISNTDEVKILAQANGLFVHGDTMISHVNRMEIVATSYTGIRAYGDLSISNVGLFDLTGAEDGIDLYGDLHFEAVDWMKIVAEDDGIYLNGDLLMEGIDWLYIDAGEYGIYASERWGNIIRGAMPGEPVSGGQIIMRNMGSVLIESGYSAIEVQAEIMLNNIGTIELEQGIWAYGAITIEQITGSLKIHTETQRYYGICSYESITMDDLTSVVVTGFAFGLHAPQLSLNRIDSLSVKASVIALLAYDDAQMIKEANTLAIVEDSPESEDGILIMSDIASAEIISEYYGLVSFSAMIINNCSNLVVEATEGESMQIEQGTSDPAPAAIVALGGPISILNSSVYASGQYFGIVTGFVTVESSEAPLGSMSLQEEASENPYSGGDILISRSFVIAEANAEIGYAGIFAGDNLGPDDEGKSQIIIEDGYVIDPEEYWIVNVSIGATNSQSITAMDIELITEWVQAANYVEIAVDSYTVTYEANGGTGTLFDPDSPYYIGDTVTILGSTFTLEDYSFKSWNTAADGSGTEYQPGDTFVIEFDVVLYAQYAEIVDEDEDDKDEDEDEDGDEDIIPNPVTSDSTRTLLPGLLILLAVAVVLKKTNHSNQKS